MESQPQSDERLFLHSVLFNREQRLRAPIRILLFIALGIFLLGICGAITRPPDLIPTPTVPWIAFYLLGDAALLGESWLFLRKLERRSFRALGLWFYAGWLRELWLGIAVGGGLQAVVAGGLVAARAAKFEGLTTDLRGFLAGLAATVAFLALAAALEEITFRGYLFQSMVRGTGPAAAIMVFSVLFGVGHLPNPSATGLSILNTMLSGVLLAVAYLKTRGLWMPIGLHWAWNFLQGPIFSFPVSGLTLGQPLFRVSVSGPKWLSGGSYGPEGSVLLAAVSILAILWLARSPKISPSPAMREALE